MLDEEAIGKSARCLCLRARWASFKEFLWENFSQPELALIFRLRGSVIPKAMIFAVPSGILAGVLHWFMALTGNQLSTVAQGSQIWSSFNFVLGVLIVFRTNQAYARYWEGATLLQQVRGEWFNATSSLFAFCTSEKRYRDDVDKFQHHVVRLMSMLYCSGLQQVALITDDKMEIIDNEGLDPEALKFLMRGVDRCEIVLQWVQRLIKDALESGVVNIPPPILSRVFQELSRGIVNVRNVQKIAEIPFPFPYTQMIMVMLILQTMLTPLLAAVTSQTSWWACLMTFITVLAFWCLNYIAAEIEQPFGEDHNDLPIPEMLKDMNKSLRMLLRPETQNYPSWTPTTADFNCAGGLVVKTKTCLEANYTTLNKDLVAGFAKSRSRTIGRLNKLQGEVFGPPIGSSVIDTGGTAHGVPRKRGQRRASFSSPEFEEDYAFEGSSSSAECGFMQDVEDSASGDHDIDAIAAEPHSNPPPESSIYSKHALDLSELRDKIQADQVTIESLSVPSADHDVYVDGPSPVEAPLECHVKDDRGQHIQGLQMYGEEKGVLVPSSSTPKSIVANGGHPSGRQGEAGSAALSTLPAVGRRKSRSLSVRVEEGRPAMVV
mmetsp:Transcript_50149/g.126410  ORF Transcript_50149/g.126410 Transcript_50149/m.126410 type:complete len:604 (-) Transcript_50149:66-1877(-)